MRQSPIATVAEHAAGGREVGIAAVDHFCTATQRSQIDLGLAVQQTVGRCGISEDSQSGNTAVRIGDQF